MNPTETKDPTQEKAFNHLGARGEKLINEISTKVNSKGRQITVLGVITMILGIAAISAPIITGLSVVLSVGLLVVTAGILRMFWAFGAGTFGKGVLAFAIGGLTLLCGLALVANPLFSFAFLTVLIATYLFVDGVTEIVGSFRLRFGSGRGWLLAGGIVSILLGMMIWRQFPLSGGWAIGIFLGIKLLFVGIAMVTGGSVVRKIAKGTTVSD